MPRTRFKAEQIIQNLREAEVLLAQGQTIAQVCKPRRSAKVQPLIQCAASFPTSTSGLRVATP